MGAFRTSPKPPMPMNHSWLAPVVAPVMGDTVAEPSEYRFASRAHGVRRSPSASTKRTATKNPTPHHGQPQAPSTNGMLSTSSSTYQQHSREQRHYDSDDRYDEFLATFQHRIDGMTGQRGGWGF